MNNLENTQSIIKWKIWTTLETALLAGEWRSSLLTKLSFLLLKIYIVEQTKRQIIEDKNT